jgi:hypothetical protein
MPKQALSVVFRPDEAELEMSGYDEEEQELIDSGFQQ